MNVLLLNASPHGAASHGHRLATSAIDSLRTGNDGPLVVIERDLVGEPLAPISRDYASAITSRAPDPAMFALSEQLIAELEACDVLVINTPMHNFTVPAALKLWLDYVIRIHRTFASTPDGKIGLLRDRPTFVLVGSGGFHTGEHARQPDFLTPYLRYALGSIGLQNVAFFLLQGLVMGDDAAASAVTAAAQEMHKHAPFNSAVRSLAPTSADAPHCAA